MTAYICTVYIYVCIYIAKTYLIPTLHWLENQRGKYVFLANTKLTSTGHSLKQLLSALVFVAFASGKEVKIKIRTD